MKKLSEVAEVRLPDDFCDVVDALRRADGWMDRVVFYFSENLRVVLEEMKFANRNARGSYGGGAKLKSLYDKKGYEAVEAAVIKFCKKRKIKVYKTRIEYHYEEVK